MEIFALLKPYPPFLYNYFLFEAKQCELVWPVVMLDFVPYGSIRHCAVSVCNYIITTSVWPCARPIIYFSVPCSSHIVVDVVF